MHGTIDLPLWAFALLVGLALVATLDRMLIPSVRWFFRRRVNRAIDRLNQKLTIKLQPFKLTARKVLIDRLVFDAKVLEAVEVEAERTGVPREVTLDRVRSYAREIVPSFNAYIYFRLGYWLARSFAQLLYRVRLSVTDAAALADIDPKATVVFVMNHRSNMDYVLVAFLAAERTALSYAVGEWARIWPLHTLLRSMGAYFVRRNSGDALYRRVLERYIQMATENGVTQAVYPEGGLSRDGKLRPPKLGFLGYMLKEFDSKRSRDIVFVPVGINYDRVIEDRSLVRSLDPESAPRSLGFTLRTSCAFVFRNLWQMLQSRWYRFGYACVNFGEPLSLGEYARLQGVDFAQLERDDFFLAVEKVSSVLMERIREAIPALPVALVASVLAANEGKLLSELEIKAKTFALIQELTKRGGFVYLPRQDQDYAITVGLRSLILRRIVLEEDGLLRVNPDDRAVLLFYANSITHLLSGSNDT